MPRKPTVKHTKTPKPQDTTVVKCPTCKLQVYAYNRHKCGQCGTKTCFFCEGNPCPTHQLAKEGTDAANKPNAGR